MPNRLELHWLLDDLRRGDKCRVVTLDEPTLQGQIGARCQLDNCIGFLNTEGYRLLDKQW